MQMLGVSYLQAEDSALMIPIAQHEFTWVYTSFGNGLLNFGAVGGAGFGQTTSNGFPYQKSPEYPHRLIDPHSLASIPHLVITVLLPLYACSLALSMFCPPLFGFCLAQSSCRAAKLSASRSNACTHMDAFKPSIQIL
jgi:hypothetical protein